MATDHIDSNEKAKQKQFSRAAKAVPSGSQSSLPVSCNVRQHKERKNYTFVQSCLIILSLLLTSSIDFSHQDRQGKEDRARFIKMKRGMH